MSSAPIFITFGRSIPLGMNPMARSIFSFTSINNRLMSLPGLNVRVIIPASVRDDDSMSFSPATCDSCRRMGATMLCSISRAELPCADICTTIRGTSTSGISDTGMRPRASTPRVAMAMSVIVTAIGRWIIFRSITAFII